MVSRKVQFFFAGSATLVRLLLRKPGCPVWVSTVRVDEACFHPLLPLLGAVGVGQHCGDVGTGACAFRSRDTNCVENVADLVFVQWKDLVPATEVSLLLRV